MFIIIHHCWWNSVSKNWCVTNKCSLCWRVFCFLYKLILSCSSSTMDYLEHGVPSYGCLSIRWHSKRWVFPLFKENFKEFLETWLSSRTLFVTNTVEIDWIEDQQKQQGNNIHTHTCTYRLVELFPPQEFSLTILDFIVKIMKKTKPLSTLPVSHIQRASTDSKTSTFPSSAISLVRNWLLFLSFLAIPNNLETVTFFFHKPSFDRAKVLTCWRHIHT